jgi:ABC-type polysaccharide/polyol phosphate export permease
MRCATALAFLDRDDAFWRHEMTEGTRRFIDLATTLVWRELLVRYKRSVFGVLWALIDPAFQVVVYLVVFGGVLGAGRDLDGYAIFTAMGVLPWLFFSVGSEQSAGALVEHGSLIRKIAFPHEVLIVAALASRMTSLLLGLAVVLVVAAAAHLAGVNTPNWSALPWAAVGLVLLTAVTAGFGFAASALQVVFGDVLFLVRFGLRLGFYACPVVYPLSRVPDSVRPLYELNPLVAVVWCFQAFSGENVPAPGIIGWTSAIVGAALALVVGWAVFRRLKGTVAELV